MTKKHHVDFIATNNIKEPTEIAFTTKAGKPVDFVAKKPVKEQVKVSFMANNKKK